MGGGGDENTPTGYTRKSNARNAHFHTVGSGTRRAKTRPRVALTIPRRPPQEKTRQQVRNILFQPKMEREGRGGCPHGLGAQDQAQGGLFLPVRIGMVAEDSGGLALARPDDPEQPRLSLSTRRVRLRAQILDRAAAAALFGTAAVAAGHAD